MHEEHLGDGADGLVVVRTATQAVELRRSGVPAERIAVIPRAVPLRGLPRREAPPASLTRWLHVARGDATGAARAVRGLAAWVHAGHAATLTVVGDLGSGVEDVVRLAQDLGVADRFTFVERRRTTVDGEDLAWIEDLLLESDLLIDPSPRPDPEVLVRALATGLPVLAVAEEEVSELLDVAQDQWAAWLLPDDDDVVPVVAGAIGLTRRLPSARFDAVRADLEYRLDPAAVDRQREMALERSRGSAGRRSVPRVVVVSLGATRAEARRAGRLVVDAVRYGGEGVLVTDRPSINPPLDPRVEVVDVSRVLERLPTHLVDRLVIDMAPRAVLRVVAVPAGRVGRARQVRGLARAHRRLARRARTAVLDRLLHGHVDPLVVAWYVMSRRRDAVVPAELVVYGGDLGIPVAARLAAASPGADVVRAADHTTVVSMARASRLRSDQPAPPPVGPR